METCPIAKLSDAFFSFFQSMHQDIATSQAILKTLVSSTSLRQAWYFFPFLLLLSLLLFFCLHLFFAGDLDLLSEDYDAVDHRLQLFLDVVVFEEEEEELHSYLKVVSQA